MNAAFGEGFGPILFDDVQCNGLEYRLFDCQHRGLEVSNCNHQRDAGVVCVPGNNFMFFIVTSWLTVQ